MGDKVHVTRTDNIQRMLLVIGALLFKGRAGTIELGEDLSMPRTSVLSTIKRINAIPVLGVTIEMDGHGDYTVAELGKLLNRDTLISMFIEYYGDRYRHIEKARQIFESNDDEFSPCASQQATPLDVDVPASIAAPEQDAAVESHSSNSDGYTPRPNSRRVSIL
jgi:biotin operon repressor